MTYHGGVRDNKYEILSTLEKHEKTDETEHGGGRRAELIYIYRTRAAVGVHIQNQSGSWLREARVYGHYASSRWGLSLPMA
jgi:hypothetical protein